MTDQFCAYLLIYTMQISPQTPMTVIDHTPMACPVRHTLITAKNYGAQVYSLCAGEHWELPHYLELPDVKVAEQ